MLLSSRTLEDDVPAEWDVGDVILDRYEVTGLLGEGGMGKVYRVHHRQWDLDLAVKCPGLSSIEEIGLERFIKEAEHWVHLGLHRHIVVCYYVRVLGGSPRLFTELVPGGNLAHWIYDGDLYAGGAEAALHRILDIAIQSAWGVQHAHDNGLVHQDIKPGNILMMRAGTAKVCDFGLAEFARVTMASGSDSVTPSYASPEQMSRRSVGTPSDVWAWGLTVMEMFMGQYPRWGPGAAHELADYMARPSDLRRPPIPAEVADLLRWCFQDSPPARPTMAVVVDSLLSLYGDAYGRPRPGEIDMRADHLNNRAVSLLDLGAVEEGRQHLDEAVMADPWHLLASYNREVLHWRLGRTTDEALLERMSELHTGRSEQWTLRYLTACIQVEKGDQDLAIEALLAAERDAKDDPVGTSMVARVRQQSRPAIRLVQTLAGATASLNAVVVCPDGRVAAVDDAGMLTFWDRVSGRPQRTVRVHHGPAVDLAMSPDGQLLVTAGVDGNVRLVDALSGRILATLSHKEPARSAAVTVEGRLIVTGSESGVLRFWDRRGKLLRTQAAHHGPVTRVRLSPAADRVATVSEDRRLCWWRVGRGEQLQDLHEHTGPVRGLVLSSTGDQAVTASDDGTLRQWDLEAGVCLHVLSGHRATVRDVVLTPDDAWAVSVGEDGTARLWELAAGRCARTMRSGTGWLHGVALDLEEQRAVVASSDMTARVWQLVWETPRTPPMVVRPRSSAELIDNRHQYLTCLDRVEARWNEGNLGAALDALVEARHVPGYERSPRCLELWAAMLRCATRVRAQRAWLLRSLSGHRAPVTSVALERSGDYVVSASEDATVRVWRVTTGECLMTLVGQHAPVHRMVMQADGERALTIGDDENIIVWDVPGECISGRLMGHLRKVRGLAMTPDGRVALSAGQEGRVRVWQMEDGTSSETLAGLGEHLAITPDGRIAALGTAGGRVRIYDLSLHRPIQVLRGHEGPVNQVVLTPDGRLAVSAGEDGTVQVFDLVRGRRQAVLEGHDRSVMCVDVTSDGRHVISGGRDRTLRVWSLDEPDAAPLVLVGHGGAVTEVKLNDDASMAVCGSSDGLLRVWHLDWELRTHPLAMWDEAANPCLDAFLSHRAAAGQTSLTDPDFADFQYQLSCRGLGWIHPEGARERLLQVAQEWTGPVELKRSNVLDED